MVAWSGIPDPAGLIAWREGPLPSGVMDEAPGCVLADDPALVANSIQWQAGLVAKRGNRAAVARDSILERPDLGGLDQQEFAVFWRSRHERRFRKLVRNDNSGTIII